MRASRTGPPSGRSRPAASCRRGTGRRRFPCACPPGHRTRAAARARRGGRRRAPPRSPPAIRAAAGSPRASRRPRSPRSRGWVSGPVQRSRRQSPPAPRRAHCVLESRLGISAWNTRIQALTTCARPGSARAGRRARPSGASAPTLGTSLPWLFRDHRRGEVPLGEGHRLDDVGVDVDRDRARSRPGGPPRPGSSGRPSARAATPRRYARPRTPSRSTDRSPTRQRTYVGGTSDRTTARTRDRAAIGPDHTGTHVGRRSRRHAPIGRAGDQDERPGLVHRLEAPARDRPVDGRHRVADRTVLVLARPNAPRRTGSARHGRVRCSGCGPSRRGARPWPRTARRCRAGRRARAGRPGSRA